MNPRSTHPNDASVFHATAKAHSRNSARLRHVMLMLVSVMYGYFQVGNEARADIHLNATAARQCAAKPDSVQPASERSAARGDSDSDSNRMSLLELREAIDRALESDSTPERRQPKATTPSVKPTMSIIVTGTMNGDQPTLSVQLQIQTQLPW